MSDKKFDYNTDDLMQDLEVLKAKYADYGVDDDAIEAINKNIVRSNPDYNAFEADFAGGFSDYEKDEPVKPIPVAEPVPVVNPAPVAEPVPVAKPVPAAKPAPAPQPVPEAQPVINEEPAPVMITPSGRQNNIESDYVERSIGHQRAMQKYADAEVAETYEEPVKEKNSKNKKKNKKKKKTHKLRNTLLIIFIFAVIWGALFGIDYVRASNLQEPFFCIKTDEYENGSKDFMGAFYKFQFHVEDDRMEVIVLPWFQEGVNKDLEKKSESKDTSEATEKTTAAAAQEVDNTIVEITILSEYIEDDTTNGIQLTEAQKQLGYKSAVLNEDGSITYQIGKTDYDKEVARIKSDTETELQNLAASTDYPSIKNVEFAEDFTNVTLYVDAAVYKTGLDHLMSKSIFRWVGYYQSFAQKDLVCDFIVKDFSDNSIVDDAQG